MGCKTITTTVYKDRRGWLTVTLHEEGKRDFSVNLSDHAIPWFNALENALLKLEEGHARSTGSECAAMDHPSPESLVETDRTTGVAATAQGEMNAHA